MKTNEMISELILKGKLAIYLAISVLFIHLHGCQENNRIPDEDPSSQMILATIDNVGEIHNYLLDQYANSSQVLELNKNSKMEDLVNNFLLINAENEKYYYDETMTRTNPAYEDFSEFLSLDLDKFDLLTIIPMVLARIDADENIDEDVKETLKTVTTLGINPLNDYNLSLIESNKNKKGGNLLVVYKNIAEASQDYWNINSVQTRGTQTRNVIIADAVGGLLGFSCGGFMSVIWGAAFSYSWDKCTDPLTVNPDNDLPKISIDEDFSIAYPL